MTEKQIWFSPSLNRNKLEKQARNSRNTCKPYHYQPIFLKGTKIQPNSGKMWKAKKTGQVPNVSRYACGLLALSGVKRAATLAPSASILICSLLSSNFIPTFRIFMNSDAYTPHRFEGTFAQKIEEQFPSRKSAMFFQQKKLFFLIQ